MKIDGTTTALVTGANGGIGAAIAWALHERGAEVVLHARRPDAVRGLAEELGARVVLADLGDREALARLHAEVGPVDLVVLNAALPASGDFLAQDEAAIDRALEVNLAAPMQTTRALVPGMVERGRGHVVFISSISGKVGTFRTSLYSATKFGLRGFAMALRSDLAPRGVGVSTVFPGFIRDAGMFAESGVEMPSAMGTRSPEDVARAVLRVVERDIGELDVAALDQRLGAFATTLAPNLAGWVMQRIPKARELADQIAEGHARAGKV